MRVEVPRFALVVWPGANQPCCITLDALEQALERGAFLIGREDAEMCGAVKVENVQSNPRKTIDADDGA